MKKFLSILFAGLLAISLFACADTKTPQKEESVRKQARMGCDTLIQDSNGEHKCFWEDGQVFFNDSFSTFPHRQTRKSATLNIQTEYDMWFRTGRRDLDLARNYYPVELEYDETKIEIKANPEKENHFILKVLQSCDKEVIITKLTSKAPLDENGEPLYIPSQINITITIGTED